MCACREWDKDIVFKTTHCPPQPLHSNHYFKWWPFFTKCLMWECLDQNFHKCNRAQRQEESFLATTLERWNCSTMDDVLKPLVHRQCTECATIILRVIHRHSLPSIGGSPPKRELVTVKTLKIRQGRLTCRKTNFRTKYWRKMNIFVLE